MSKLTILDIIENSGADTIVLTKHEGVYKVFSKTDSVLDAVRELVAIYKKMGKSKEEIIELMKI